MATKENFLLLKQNIHSTQSSSDKSNTFLNFNLNQNNNVSSYPCVQVHNKSNNDKTFGYTVTDHCHEQRKSWNKLTTNSSLSKTTSKNSFINDDIKEKELQKSWKNDNKNSNAKNGSTLSLHIAAYENSIEATSNESEEFSKKSKIFKSAISSFQGNNSFEFPRQMEDNESSKPEIQQFKASQKLSSPNQSAAVSSNKMQLPQIIKEQNQSEMAEVDSTITAPSTGGGEVSYPLKVTYCGACSMPLEYCEYSTCKDACREWLEKNLPNLAGDITIGDGGDEKKHQKRGGKGTSGKGSSKKQQEPAKVTLQLSARSKNKNVTLVKGLATFGVDLKVASKVFSSKFACGCSVTGADEITIQGDFSDQLFDLIPEKWKQIDEDSIEDLGGEPNAKR